MMKYLTSSTFDHEIQEEKIKRIYPKFFKNEYFYYQIKKFYLKIKRKQI